MSGIRQGVWAYQQRLALIKALGDKCEMCGSTRRLEIDHKHGRAYSLNRLSRWQRVIIYKREAAHGLLRVLCRRCNSRDGARMRWPGLSTRSEA